MGKIIKSWWFWVVAALGVVALAFLRYNELPAEPPSAVAEAVDVMPPLEETDPLAGANVAAVETPAAILEAAKNDPVAISEAEAVVSQIADPLGNATVVVMPVEPTEEAVIASEVDMHETDARPEKVTPPLPSEDIAMDIQEAVNEAEDLSADPVPELESPEESALQTAEVEVVETPPAPELPPPNPIQPALAQSAPALGSSPENGAEQASPPAAEVPPLLGEASPPLTLAQVLPLGEAPAPNQISPSFDLVRVSPDGSALIAGRAAPGANVQVLSGTIPVAEATATARGEFVVFLNAPSATTLDSQIPAAPEGAALVVSQEDIVILPAAADAADTTPIVVHRTPDAVHIVQPAAPAVPLNVSLDLVSYADSGAVQLSGRGQPGNVARIYTDGKLAGEAPIAEGGTWELEVSDVAEGRYVLRVDEIAPSGEVISRTESPFQRQFPEAEMPESFSQGAKIIVQPGNTLWLMATEAYGNGDAFSQIYSANKDTIRDPDLIYPGQIFSIPRIEE